MLVIVTTSTYQSKNHYFNIVITSVEQHVNDITVEPMLWVRQDPKEIVQYKEAVTFTVERGRNRTVSWSMRPKNNEYIPGSLRFGNEQVAAGLELKYKDRLKKIGNEAYTMWKIGQ